VNSLYGRLNMYNTLKCALQEQLLPEDSHCILNDSNHDRLTCLHHKQYLLEVEDLVGFPQTFSRLTLACYL